MLMWSIHLGVVKLHKLLNFLVYAVSYFPGFSKMACYYFDSTAKINTIFLEVG